MDYCGLSKEFLVDAEKYCSYDENIPFQYRVIAKLIGDTDYDMARKLIESNKDAFDNDYNYLIIDLAIEMSLNFIVDESGKLHTTFNLNERQVYKPTPDTVKFIEYLLENGANPNLPEHFNQIEHINDLESDSSEQYGCVFDCSEIKNLLAQYM